MVLNLIRFSTPLVFFFVSMFFGALLVVISGGLLGVWVGLECGFLGVVSVLSGDSVQENESCMKYFVFQSIGSGILFLVFILLGSGAGSFYSWGLFILGVCLKLGLFPFYFWVPSVMSLCSWFGCFAVSVWQKVAPLWFLSSCGLSYFLMHVLEVFSCVTGFIGAVGGLGLLHYRMLLGYSSLIHTSWMVLVAMVSGFGVLVYLVVYGVVLGVLMKDLFFLKVYSFLDFSSASGPSFKSIFSVFLGFISLAGVPPFLGFFPKVLAVLVCWGSFPGGVLVLVFCSMVSLYYYLSVVISSGVGVGAGPHLFSAETLKAGLTVSKVLVGFCYLVGLFLLAGVGFLG
uniref:NADH dehydrogenase subunit 2 n=1 Tax=Xyloredo nooi TaxID=2584333 RepID=UPI0020288B1C|nr:NADH dehydrogenase subunit 2 [Xyloredo nooi]UPX88993.1 NADH dehydrogenase subunit 2 [Xyloredo nooi]UPX89005.1 NADH dehydrogenase subunit 2 [Xyloredo nooi]